jgi:hypothetical protein
MAFISNSNKDYSVKYLSLILTFFVASAFAAEPELQCGADTDLNPNNRFSHDVLATDIGDYKVINDATTGLQWSYCFVGQTFDSQQDVCLGVPTVPYELSDSNYNSNIRQASMDAVESENQQLGTLGHPWRLPNIKELIGIYNEQCVPANYPAFSYAINVSQSEIEDLGNTPYSTDETIIGYHTAISARQKSAVYQNMTITSDTVLLDRDYLHYYTVDFSGWGSLLNQLRRTSGMLRLVREIPKE